jgi:hypothetical protein
MVTRGLPSHGDLIAGADGYANSILDRDCTNHQTRRQEDLALAFAKLATFRSPAIFLPAILP